MKVMDINVVILMKRGMESEFLVRGELICNAGACVFILLKGIQIHQAF